MIDDLEHESLELDEKARAELDITCYDFGVKGRGSRGDDYGVIVLERGNELVGRISYYRVNEWLLQTDRWFVADQFRFDKAKLGAGEPQPRYALILASELFSRFADWTIRESPAENNEAGKPLVKRLREGWGFPYHESSCFFHDEGGQLSGGCVCGLQTPTPVKA